jgi:hypothetical protein
VQPSSTNSPSLSCWWAFSETVRRTCKDVEHGRGASEAARSDRLRCLPCCHLVDKWSHEEMTESETILLAVYVLQQTKRYVPYCGGPSRIYLLRHDGRVDMVPHQSVSGLEWYKRSI